MKFFTWFFIGVAYIGALVSGGTYLVYLIASCVQYYQHHGLTLGFIVFCAFSEILALILPFVDGISKGAWLPVLGIYGGFALYMVAASIGGTLGVADEKRARQRT